MTVLASASRANMLTARIRGASDQRPRQRSASWSLVGKSVSDAIEGLDGPELGIDRPELAPEPLDVAVDGAVVDIDFVVISCIHQLVTRLNEAGSLGQCVKD